MTGHGTNDQDARALTYLARRLRTETHGCREWDEAGTYAKVSELTGQNLALTIERVLCHATDPEAKTPGAILRNFTPPKPSQRETAKRGNPHRDEECREHPGQWPDTCASCKTEAYDPHAETSPDVPSAAVVNPNLAQRLAAYTKGNADE
jgi:hypothetical protein